MNTLLRVFEHLKRLFISGLLTLLPLMLTVTLIGFGIRLIRSWLTPIRNLLPAVLQVPFLDVVLAILFIILAGLFFQFFLVHKIWDLFEALVGKIPLLRPIYFSAKKLVTAFSPQEDGFQKIALIEFPRKGLYSIAFISVYVPREIAPTDELYYNAFIPAAPNPTSGFFVLIRADECTVLDISKQEAITIILSGGIVQPERFQEKNPRH